MESDLVSIDFEVFGRVQGVFFRKYTKSKADELHLVGWCKNTSEGTVSGHLEGDRKSVAEMKVWLQTTGSPYSKIEKANFTTENEIESKSFDQFSVRRE